MAGKPGLPEGEDQLFARSISIGMIEVAEVGSAPVLQRLNQFAMPVFEEGPVKVALVRHQLPSNTGFSLATKAW